MKPDRLLCLLSVFLFITGCDAAVSSNPYNYVGEYVFTPFGTSPENLAGFVILKRDSTAIEIRFFKDTDQVKIIQTKWRLFRSNGENVVIGTAGYKVETLRGTIRLAINYDLDEFYEKIR